MASLVMAYEGWARVMGCVSPGAWQSDVTTRGPECDGV